MKYNIKGLNVGEILTVEGDRKKIHPSVCAHAKRFNKKFKCSASGTLVTITRLQ